MIDAVIYHRQQNKAGSKTTKQMSSAEVYGIAISVI
jgi:hypothetical protein